MSVFDHPEFDNHEHVAFYHDEEGGPECHYCCTQYQSGASTWRLSHVALRK